jgi:hypothetical protein
MSELNMAVGRVRNLKMKRLPLRYEARIYNSKVSPCNEGL